MKSAGKAAQVKERRSKGDSDEDMTSSDTIIDYKVC
jgi:hypothetical protein